MSVILIDQFQYESVLTPLTYNVYQINFNNATAVFTVGYTGADGQLATVNAVQRQRIADSEIARIISDDALNIYVLNVSLNTPFAYISATLPNTPAPPSCDLAFTSVAVVAESAQGANNGTITATATTSFATLEYSINGVNWFASGAFVNLVPANYIVRARDANGCAISQGVAVEAYNNPISGGFTSGLPVVLVSAGNISKWNAVYNPIVIDFQRNDNQIYAIADAGGGYINVTINGLYSAGEIALALTTAVIIKGAKYDINSVALQVTTVGGRSVIKILSAYFGVDTGVVFIEQTKPNYKIELIITTGATLYKTTTVAGAWSPDLTGKIRCDLATYLQSIVNAEDAFAYDVINWKDGNRGASYTIKYREAWDGSNNPYYNAPYPLYVVYSAMQLGQKHGGNMAEYVPFYAEPNNDLKAKFMTDFIEPKLWVGLPWDISFIFSEGLVNQVIKVRVTSLDINKNLVIGGEINSFLLNTDAGYLMTSDTGRFLIKRGALPPVDQADLIEALGVNRLMIPGNPGAGVEYLRLQLYRGTDLAPYFVTQPVDIKVERPCDGDPYIYVKWLNKLGGWNYHRFGHRQDVSLDTRNLVTVKRNVFNWETDQTIADVTQKSAFKNISFGVSGVNRNYVDGLQGLASAIRVQVLNRVDPIQWHTVEIATGSFKLYGTRGGLFDLKFELTLPEINIQQQ